MKLGIILDSSSGLSKAEANKRGWGFLPLYFNINGKEYADGIDLTQNSYYKIINLEAEVKTSATPPSLALEEFEKMSKKFDHVIVYALSNKLSSQTSNLIMLAKNFNNIFVVPSHGLGRAVVHDCMFLEKMALEGASWDEIKKESEDMTRTIFGVAAPKTMKWLVKGGRIGASAAGMANLLKIVPLISYEDGGLGKYGKGRVFNKTIVKLCRELYEKFGDDREYLIYHADNKDINLHQKNIEKILNKKIHVDYFPSVITNHIGLGTIAIITRKKT